MAYGGVEMTKHGKKRMIESSINLLRHYIGVKLPELELIELPSVRTTRFAEEALEYEIVLKVRPAREKAKSGAQRAASGAALP